MPTDRLVIIGDVSAAELESARSGLASLGFKGTSLVVTDEMEQAFARTWRPDEVDFGIFQYHDYVAACLEETCELGEWDFVEGVIFGPHPQPITDDCLSAKCARAVVLQAFATLTPGPVLGICRGPEGAVALVGYMSQREDPPVLAALSFP